MDEARTEQSLRVVEQCAGELILIEGDLCEANTVELERRLRALKLKPDGAIKLDLYALDCEDGVAVATLVNSIRELLARSSRVTITGAPQVLGHNLYRVGLLGSVELVDMRLDEAAGF